MGIQNCNPRKFGGSGVRFWVRSIICLVFLFNDQISSSISDRQEVKQVFILNQLDYNVNLCSELFQSVQLQFIPGKVLPFETVQLKLRCISTAVGNIVENIVHVTIGSKKFFCMKQPYFRVDFQSVSFFFKFLFRLFDVLLWFPRKSDNFQSWITSILTSNRGGNCV